MYKRQLRKRVLHLQTPFIYFIFTVLLIMPFLMKGAHLEGILIQVLLKQLSAGLVIMVATSMDLRSRGLILSVICQA